MDDSEYLDSTSTHRSLAQAMHDTEQSEHWDSFLRRAETRGRLGNTFKGEQDDLAARAPKVGERLWEIGCKVRCYVLVHTFFDNLNYLRLVVKSWQPSRRCLEQHIRHIRIFKLNLSLPAQHSLVVYSLKYIPLLKQRISPVRFQN